MDEPARHRNDGFTERGAQVTRLEAFVDAAFAFALTMLVIAVGTIPDTSEKLIEALKGIPAFAASFAQIAAFWYQHMMWSRRYGLDDRGSVLLSLLLVFLVMVFVYPLKVVASTFFAWITSGWLPAAFWIHTGFDLRVMFVVYGLMFGSMAIVTSLLYRQAWTRRDALGLSPEERLATFEAVWHGVATACVAALSILLALGLPERGPTWRMALPGMAYALLGLSRVLEARLARVWWARHGASPST